MDAKSPRKPTRAKRPWAGNMREVLNMRIETTKEGISYAVSIYPETRVCNQIVGSIGDAFDELQAHDAAIQCQGGIILCGGELRFSRATHLSAFIYSRRNG